MTSTQQRDPDADVVEVSTPADGSFVSTLRLAAASLGSRCGLTVDDIEDLRLAVDEACALLLPHAAAGGRLHARFELAPGRLTVASSVEGAAGEPDRDGFAWTVLDALATSVDVRNDGERLTIAVAKAREVAQT